MDVAAIVGLALAAAALCALLKRYHGEYALLVSVGTGLLIAAQLFSSLIPVLDEINRLMEYYSFKTPQLADRFADLLEGRYRYEIFAIYGPSLLLRKSSDSSYLRLDQLLSSLIRVAVLRLCCEGIYSLTSSQIASGDGLLYLALQKQIAG